MTATNTDRSKSFKSGGGIIQINSMNKDQSVRDRSLQQGSGAPPAGTAMQVHTAAFTNTGHHLTPAL